MTYRTHRLRNLATLALAIIATASTSIAFSQEPTELDRVQVTGSRIRSTDIETAQPIIALTRADIQQQGYTSVADILQNLPIAGSPAISRLASLSSGENVGGYYIDMRNLGANRTLVLVNGRRLGATTGGYQDLSQIPIAVIERMEILKDGASSIYGSDAIAGVVNIITRTNFDGAEANAYFGQFTEGDGDKKSFDFTIGADGERSNVVMSLSYAKEDPVWARDRWFSHTSRNPSVISQYGSWLGPCGPDGNDAWCTLQPGADPSKLESYSPLRDDQRANSNEQMMLQTGIETRNLYTAGHFDFTDNIRFTAEAMYNDRKTQQEIAGYPYQSAPAAFNTPLSKDSIYNFTDDDIHFRRRLWEVPRTTESTLKTYRFAGGLEGFFEFAGRTWDWDVGAIFNRNEAIRRQRGDASLVASRQALGPSFIDDDGIAHCGSVGNVIDGCVPWNPLLPYGNFDAGSLHDPNVQTYLFPNYTSTGKTRTTIYSANLSGSLFTLPAGDLGIALGYEKRKESGNYVPDAFAQQENLYTGLAATTTKGEYSLDEFYLELSVPLLRDLPGAKELTLNASSRYSDYSNFGDTTNSKFQLVWRPFDDLMLRATYAEGFRAPSINNLYGGTTGGFQFYTDPCAGAGSTNPRCAADGVPPGYVQLGQGGNPCVASRCQSGYALTSGSNPDLDSETAKNKSIGLVFSPSFIDGLNITLDWYDIKIEDLIATSSPTEVLNDCYLNGIESRCSSIVRNSDGAVTSMFYGLTNKGYAKTQGYDFGINYRLPEFSIGQFTIDWQTNYVSKFDIKQDDNAATIVNKARGYAYEDTLYFRIRSNLGLSWQKGDYSARWMARYTSDIKEACGSLDECNMPGYTSTIIPDSVPGARKVGSNTFHDLQFNWNAPWNATVSIGSNNIFNHRAAQLYSQPASSFPYYGGYDIGRFVYMKYQQRF